MDNRQERQDAKIWLQEPTIAVDDSAHRVIGAAIEVHRHLGPGFAESVYDDALAVEFRLREIVFARQPSIRVHYKGHAVGEGRPDFIVGGSLIVEVKAVSQLLPIHSAQVLSYLKAQRATLGLLLNFKESTMRQGIKRVVLNCARRSEREDRAFDMDEAQENSAGLVVQRRNTSVA